MAREGRASTGEHQRSVSVAGHRRVVMMLRRCDVAWLYCNVAWLYWCIGAQMPCMDGTRCGGPRVLTERWRGTWGRVDASGGGGPGGRTPGATSRCSAARSSVSPGAWHPLYSESWPLAPSCGIVHHAVAHEALMVRSGSTRGRVRALAGGAWQQYARAGAAQSMRVQGSSHAVNAKSDALEAPGRTPSCGARLRPR